MAWPTIECFPSVQSARPVLPTCTLMRGGTGPPPRAVTPAAAPARWMRAGGWVIHPLSCAQWASTTPDATVLPCTACPDGYTTLTVAEGAASLGDCVIQPGWYYDRNKTLAAPCVKGSYSVGATAQAQEVFECTLCAAGYTTTEQESTSMADCNGECPAALGCSFQPLRPPAASDCTASTVTA